MGKKEVWFRVGGRADLSRLLICEKQRWVGYGSYRARGERVHLTDTEACRYRLEPLLRSDEE